MRSQGRSGVVGRDGQRMRSRCQAGGQGVLLRGGWGSHGRGLARIGGWKALAPWPRLVQAGLLLDAGRSVREGRWRHVVNWSASAPVIWRTCDCIHEHGWFWVNMLLRRKLVGLRIEV